MIRTSVLIWSDMQRRDDGRWQAVWHVGTRYGQGVFDTQEEAREFIRRNINRETGF